MIVVPRNLQRGCEEMLLVKVSRQVLVFNEKGVEERSGTEIWGSRQPCIKSSFFFGWFAKLLASSCLSFSSRVSTWLLLDGYAWNLILDTFIKICCENPKFLKIGQNVWHLFYCNMRYICSDIRRPKRFCGKSWNRCKENNFSSLKILPVFPLMFIVY